MPQFNLADYEEVKDRIPKFYERYPEGRIITRVAWIAEDASRIIIEASLYASPEDQQMKLALATGLAEETQGVGMVNKTAHVENCETSAIGRAIYNSPLAEPGKPRPSREEMEKVARSEKRTKKDVNLEASEDYYERLEKARKAFFAHARDVGIESNIAKELAKEVAGGKDSFNDLNIDDLRLAYKALDSAAASGWGED